MTFLEFPNDSTGDALRRLQDDGADLSKPHEIDFHIAVPDWGAGQFVMNAAMQMGFVVNLNKNAENDEWTCSCSKTMIPGHAAISRIETVLDAVAQKVGGRFDGWGAFPTR